MANYNSIIHNYGKPQSNFNQELALQALSYKQGKYDANAAKIQETLNNYGNIELARPEDREYLYERINGLVNNINGLGSADLSSTNVTSGIMGHISKAIDQNVITQIGNTQKIKAFQTDVQAIKKAGKGEYADVNYQVALMKAGYVDYMNGQDKDGNKVDELGSLTYTPYVDVSGELTKKLKDITTIKGGKQVWQERDGQGNIIEYELNGMTESQLTALIPNLLDDRMRGQMNVNGYYRYGGDKEVAKQNILPHYQAKLDKIDLDITNVRTKMESGKKDPTETAKLKQEIEGLQAQKDSTQKTYNRLSEGDAGFIGGYLEEQSLTSSMASTLHAEVNKKYLADNAYFKSLEIAERRRANDLKEKEMDATSGIPDATSAPVATELLDGINTYETIKAEGEKLGKEYYADSNQFYNNLDDAQKKKVDNLSTNVKYQGLTDNEKKTQAMLDAGVLDPNATGHLNNLGRKYKNYLEDDQKLYEQTLTNAFESDDFYNSLVNNKNITLVDDNNRRTSYAEYFKNKGINSEDDYNRFIKDKEKSKDFKSKVISDNLLSSATSSEYEQTSATIGAFLGQKRNNLGHVLKGMEAGNIDKNLLLNVDRLVKTTGEDLGFTDLFEVESVSDDISFGRTALSMLLPQFSGAILGGTPIKGEPVDQEFINKHKGDLKQRYKIKLNPKAAGTKAYQVLKTALDNGTWDNNSTVASDNLSFDNSVQDDSTLRTALSYDKFETGYKEKITQSGLRLKGFNSIYIQPSTGEKNKVQIFEALRKVLAAGKPIEGMDEKKFLNKLDLGAGIELSRKPGDTDNYVIKQGNKMAIIPKNVLEQEPEVMKLIDLEENEKQLVRENEPPLKVANFNYRPQDIENLDYLVNRYGSNTLMIKASTKEGAKELLQQDVTNPDQMKVFDVAMNNANRFSAEVKNVGGRNYVDVLFDGERISQISGSNIDRGQIEGIVDYDPQIFITLALKNIAIEVKNQNTDNFKKLFDALRQQ